MLPGVQKIKGQIAEANLDDKIIRRQIAVIRSMTKAERQKPDLLNASRRRRIAKGAGVDVAEVNKVLKMHRGMADMVKSMGKGKNPFGGMMPNMPGMPGGGRMPSPEQLKALGGGKLPGLPGGGSGLPGLPGLPGVGGGLPGLPRLPGLPGSKDKK
jgi:signal recognition particle subunit SRP54